MTSLLETLDGIDRCPRCGIAQPLLSKVWVDALIDRDRQKAHLYGVYKCSSCCLGVLAEGTTAHLNRYGEIEDLEGASRVARIFPKQSVVDAALPQRARHYLKQALETLHAPDASAVMSASAVDAMLKERGYQKGSLYARIGQAVENHLLTEAMAEWAHAVRLEANAVRHADANDQPLTTDDAKQILEFAKALGDFLFVFSARVSAGLQKAKPNGGDAVS